MQGWLQVLALLFILEGLLPLLFPQTWRQTFQRLLQLRDGQLRFIGLLVIAGGLALLLLS